MVIWSKDICDCALLVHRRGGTISSMTETEQLPDEELGRSAAEWRKRALQGDLHARGMAHELETELRRRNGAQLPVFDTLDLRSLESRQKRPSRWLFWKRTGNDTQ